MADPNEIVLKLTLNDKEFTSRIQLSNSEIKSLRGESEQMNSSVSKWAIGVTGFNQALELGSKLVGIFTKPLEVAGQFEQYRVALKVMLGDAKAAQDRLDELSKFAAVTPFELPEVVNAANKLQTIGKYSKELLTNLGDLASASGKPFEQATTAYLKLASGQKGEAMEMFRDLLISNDDWIAATGKGVAANGELKASYQEMLDAVPKIIKNKNFAGMMDQQSQTWKGIMSNVKDEMTRTAEGIGESFLPAAKEIAGNIIPTLTYLRENIGEIAPVLGVATAATLLYITATRAQAIAEALSMKTIMNSGIALMVKGVALRLSSSAENLATASTLAHGLMTDVLTGKITVAAAVQQAYTLSTMILGSVMTLLAGTLAIVAAGWGVYEMTTGKARNAMGELALKNAQVKLGLDDLQSRLNSFSFNKLIDEIANGDFALKSLQARLAGLKAQTGTGSGFLDLVGTGFGLWGNSNKIYDQIKVTEKQIEAQTEFNSQVEAYAKKVEKAKEYTSKFDETTLKSLKSINQVKAARESFTIAKDSAETDKDRESMKSWGEQLEQLEKKLNNTKGDKKPKTYDEEVKDKIKYYDDLTEIDKKYDGNYKKYLDDQIKYYTVTLVAKKGSLQKLSTDEIDVLKTLLDKKKALETGDQKEIDKLRIDAMKAGYDKDLSVIENWYKEQQELKLYKKNAEAKALIDKQYAQKKIDLQKETEKKIAQVQIDAMPSGYGKEKAQLDQWYKEQQASDLYKPNSVFKASIDIQYESKGADIEKKKQAEITQARIEAMQDGFDKEDQIIREWYAGQTELELYKTNADYKLSIDQQYYNKRLELARKEITDRNEISGAMLVGYNSFMSNVLRTDMSGAEKRMAIMDAVKNYLWQKLTEELSQFIITKAAEVLIHTGAEGAKTTVTGVGVGARIALIGMEILATIAAAAASMVHAVASIIEWEIASFGPFALLTIPASIAAMVGIFSAAKSALGFDQGGLLKKGERGYFEGNRDEIIAPKDTFIDVVNQTILPRVIETKQMPVMDLLNRGRDLIANSVMQARSTSNRQSNVNQSGGEAGIQTMIDKMSFNLSSKLDQVIQAFLGKQWVMSGTNMKTVQDNATLILNDLRF